MKGKINFLISGVLLWGALNCAVNASAQNINASPQVDNRLYGKYISEIVKLNDRYKWRGLLKNPDSYKRAAAARALRFEMFKQAFDPRYSDFPARELLRELKFAVLNDESLLVRMEAGYSWLVWNRVDREYSEYSRQELKEIMLLFFRGLTANDPEIRGLSFEVSGAMGGAIKSFLRARRDNAEVIIAIFHEIKQRLEEAKEETLQRDIFFVFLSFLSSRQQGIIFDGQGALAEELSIKSEGIDGTQINELLKWGLRTKDNAICISLLVHHGRWLVYPEFIPELLELLNHDNTNNSGDIRRYAAEYLKSIGHGEVVAKLREGFIRDYFNPKLLEAYELGADLGVKEVVPGLSGRLKSDLTMKEVAVISRSLLKLKGKEAVPAILDSLDNIINWSSGTAGNIGRVLLEYEPGIIEQLGERLKTANKNGQESVCMILGELSDPRANKYLTECLNSPNFWVSERAAVYLGKKAAEPDVESLIRLSEAARVRAEEVKAAGKKAGKKPDFISSEKASEILWNYPEVKDIQEKYRCDKYQCVGRGFGGGVTRFPNRDFPFYAMHFNVTQEIEKSPKVFESREVKSWLFYIDAYTGEVYSQEAYRQKILAQEQAQKLREQEQAELIKQELPLKAELEKKSAEILEKRFSGVNEEYRKLLQDALPLFVNSLNAATPAIRYQGVLILGQLARFDESMGGYKAKQAIPGLIGLLQEKEYGTRYQAVEALGEIGDRNDRDLVKAILPLVEDSDSLVRRGAIVALSKLGDSSLTPMLVNLLNDSSVNQEAVKALMQVGDDRAIEPLLLLFKNKAYFYLEKDIVYALGRTGGARSIPALIGLLGREYTRDNQQHQEFQPATPFVGIDAGQALAKIGKESVAYLLEALAARDHLTRLYAVYSLNLLKDVSVLGRLQGVLLTEDNPTVRIYLQKAIAEISGGKFSLPFAALKIKIEPSQQQYKRKEDINFNFYLRNDGTEPVVINTASLKYGDAWFQVIAPDNKPAAYIGVKEDRMSSFPVKDDLITLNPGQVYQTAVYYLQHDYDFSKPGAYRVSGVYRNNFDAIEFGVYAWEGKIESDPVTVYLE